MNRKIKIILAITMPILVLLITGIVVAKAAFYTSSLVMQARQLYPIRTSFTWTPSVLPGWQLDPNAPCAGTVRVNLNNYVCALFHTVLSDGRILFVFTLPETLCGKTNVSLQPFLALYNFNTNIHDIAYGDMIVTNEFSVCKMRVLPVIMNQYYNPYP